jgi:hypothetical protein
MRATGKIQESEQIKKRNSQRTYRLHGAFLSSFFNHGIGFRLLVHAHAAPTMVVIAQNV